MCGGTVTTRLPAAVFGGPMCSRPLTSKAVRSTRTTEVRGATTRVEQARLVTSDREPDETRRDVVGWTGMGRSNGNRRRGSEDPSIRGSGGSDEASAGTRLSEVCCLSRRAIGGIRTSVALAPNQRLGYLIPTQSHAGRRTHWPPTSSHGTRIEAARTNDSVPIGGTLSRTVGMAVSS